MERQVQRYQKKKKRGGEKKKKKKMAQPWTERAMIEDLTRTDTRTQESTTKVVLLNKYEIISLYIAEYTLLNNRHRKYCCAIIGRKKI